MALKFGKVRLVKTLEGLSPLQRKRAWACWQFCGGSDEYNSLEEMLAAQDVERRVVRDEKGERVAEWWQIWDGGLLFKRGSARVIGEAIQHGFVCRDRTLWTALAGADNRPGFIDWSLGEEGDIDSLWSPPKAPDKV